MRVIIMLLALMLNTSACNPQEESWRAPIKQPEQPAQPSSNAILITANNTSFAATLDDNQTTEALRAMLPLTVTMHEMNSNEKYCSLPAGLPTNSSSPGTILSGDIMLFGSSTLVLFYKTFSTSYSYTRVGAIDNPTGLESILGGDSVTVRFEMVEQ